MTVALGAAHAALLLTNLPAIALTPAALPGGTAGAAYGQALSAAGGRGGPFQFAVTAGALPAGLSLSAAGLLGGTTTAAGTFTFTVTATGAGGFTGLQTYQLIIDPSSPGTPPGPSPTPAAPADPPGTLPPGNAAPQPSPGRPPRHTRHRGRKRKAGGHSRHPGRPRGRAPRA